MWDEMQDVISDSIAVYRESLPVLILSLFGGVIAGTILGGDGMRNAFAAIPGLLLMIPAIMAMRGNIYGAMGARIATALHQGIIEPELRRQDRLQTVIIAAIVNGLTLAVFIAVSSRTILYVFGLPSASLGTLLAVTLVSTVLSAVAMIGTLVTLLFWGFRRDMDPNVLNGPIVTTAGDVFGVTFIYIAVFLVEVII
jgi:mgtE-like transporter